MSATITTRPLSRDEILIARKAFEDGYHAHREWCRNNTSDGQRWDSLEFKADQSQRYPLPKVTRPRVVDDPHRPHTKWRCIGEALQFSDDGETWFAAADAAIDTNARIRLLVDLLDNPTEEVEG